MNRKLIISENHILRLILDELNDNSLGVKFMLSNWFVSDENDGTLFIQRRAFDNDRFDIVEEFDGDTYAIKETQITPFGINSLNADFLTHPQIQEISYSPQIMFLVSADQEVNVTANRTALEEVRTRLMQYEKQFEISQFDLDDLDKRTTQKMKAIFTSGELHYGDTEYINGKGYMTMSLALNIFVTNYGEFANQQKFSFGTSAILKNGKPEMFEIPLITWDYGMALDTDPTQLVLKMAGNNERASEVINYKVSKAFAMSFTVQIDFKNEFLKHIYLESLVKKVSVPTYYIEMWTNYYDENNVFKELEGSRIKRTFNLDLNKPTEAVSLGDKLEYVISFSPSEESWFE